MLIAMNMIMQPLDSYPKTEKNSVLIGLLFWYQIHESNSFFALLKYKEKKSQLWKKSIKK